MISARSAVLVEMRTGTVLYEKNADLATPPASLAKLMTLFLVLDRISAGALDSRQVIIPEPQAWARNMPPRSSVMFLGPDQRVTIETLMKGLVVDSGNDAAVQLALSVAGSVPAFVHLMNEEAERLGYTSLRFADPAGIDEKNRITAREYADFCRRFITLYPGTLASLFSAPGMSYPLPENRTAGNREKTITQPNRNELLGRYEGVDGLKTGYTEEAGFNMAATAEREGMRLIGVILGIPGTPASGARLERLAETRSLLDYGFGNFVVVEPRGFAVEPVRVWKGGARTVEIAPRIRPSVVLWKEDAALVRTSVSQKEDVVAPVSAGQTLGQLELRVGGKVVGRFPLVAVRGVERGSFLRRAVDGVLLLFHPVR